MSIWTRNLGDAIAPGWTESAAKDAKERAEHIATELHLPQTAIETAGATAVGMIAAKQYTGLGA